MDAQPEARTEVRAIYDEVMGPALDGLAAPVRAFHRAASPVRFAGRASVVRGASPLAGIVAAMIGLPPAHADCAVVVDIDRDAQGVEAWRRSFDGKVFASRQEPGRGGWTGLMVERIGPMAFAYALHERGGALHLELRGWTALGMPMPAVLGPRATAFEHGADGRFNFDVDMALPLIGRLVRYRGWLEPVG